MTGSSQPGRRVAERCERFARAVGRFLDPSDPIRGRLFAGSAHFDPDTLAEGLELSLRGWTDGGRILRYVEGEIGQSAVYPEHAVVVLGGVLPPSHVQAIAYPYWLGATVAVKAPRSDLVFPALFSEALGEDVALVQAEELAGALATSDAVVAVGSDAAVRAIAAQTPVATPFLGFGARTAVGLVGGTVSPETIMGLMTDIATFDQRGCLSPTEILVEEGVGEEVSERLAVALAACRSRRSLGAAEDAVRRWVDLAHVRGDRFVGPADRGFGVLLKRGGVYEGTPGGRHVIVREVEDAMAALAPLRGHLSAVCIEGMALDAKQLARFGAARVVAPGQLQATPPEWPHDGRRPLVSLCRYVDVEGPA